MTVKSYNPAELILTFNGYNITGIADGTFVNIERNADMWSLNIGSGGEGARAKSNNRSARITFTTQQTSASNDILSALALADEVSGAGAGPLQIKDNNGTSLYTAATAWIVKYAPSTFSNEITNREWVLETDELLTLVGSNS